MLNPIASANWNYDAAAHLALRASFGEPPAELEKWVNQGLDSTLERLLRTPSPSVAPPDWAYPTRDEDLLSRIRNAATAAEDRAQLQRQLGILPEEVGLPKGPRKPSPSPTAKQLTVSGQTHTVANSPSPKPTVALIPPPAPTPPSQLTGGLPVGRFLTADDRRDSRRALQKLCQCIFQANPRPEFLEKFVQIANSKPHLDDRAIRDLAILMMSTPNYQLC